jgi:hypothetical protein
MTNRTLWDEEFKELNSIELSETQKVKLWKNITSKKQNRFEFFKYGLIYSAAIALFLVLTASFISGKIHTKDHSADQPARPAKPTQQAQPVKIVPNQIISKAGSADWGEALERLRYDEGVIEKIKTDQKQVSIIVKLTNRYGSDADPLGTVIKPDSGTKEYLLTTSKLNETLHLEVNQKVLLLVGLYQKKGSTDNFWGGEVTGIMQKDGKYYDSDGKLLNLRISNQVNITNGILK